MNSVELIRQFREAKRMRKVLSWRKMLRRKWRRTRLRLSTQCIGTSVITETDEMGKRFFPRTIVPVTTRSFVFTDVGDQHVLAPPTPSRLRAMAIDEDPPMIDLGNESGVQYLVRDEPGSGDIFGIRDGYIVRCRLTLPHVSALTQVEGPIHSFAAAGNGTFVILSHDNDTNIVPVRLTLQGERQPLWVGRDVGNFFPRALAVKDGRVFVGGLRGGTEGPPYMLTAEILMIPLTGQGDLPRQVAHLGAYPIGEPGISDQQRAFREPAHMAFLGSDLIVASRPIYDNSGISNGIEPSHIIRLRLNAAGIEESRAEIPVSHPDNFLVVVDLKTLDDQIFIIDWRNARIGSQKIMRILRVCPD